MLRVLWMTILLAHALIGGEPLLFATRHIEKKIPGCGDAKYGCAFVDFNYVQAISGPEPVRSRINAEIRKSISPTFCYAEDAHTGIRLEFSPEECASQYVKDGQTAATNSGTPRCHLWASVKVLLSTSSLVSLESSEAYEGGAHPNSNTCSRTLCQISPR